MGTIRCAQPKLRKDHFQKRKRMTIEWVCWYMERGWLPSQETNRQHCSSFPARSMRAAMDWRCMEGLNGFISRVYLWHAAVPSHQFFFGGRGKDLLLCCVLLSMLQWTILLAYVSAVTAGNRWVSFWYDPASYGGSDINATVSRYSEYRTKINQISVQHPAPSLALSDSRAHLECVYSPLSHAAQHG